MPRSATLVGQRADGGLPDRREVIETHKEFLVAQQQPETVEGDVRDLRHATTVHWQSNRLVHRHAKSIHSSPDHPVLDGD